MGDREGQTALDDMDPESYYDLDADADRNFDGLESDEECNGRADIDEEMELDDEYPGLA